MLRCLPSPLPGLCNRDGHVRVDIFYAEMPEKKRALVDLLGSLVFLIPFCIFILVIAWPYVANSWKLLEELARSRRVTAGLSAEIPDHGFAGIIARPGFYQRDRRVENPA